MRLVFGERAWEDYLFWRRADPKLLARLNGLIKQCQRTPLKGTGKPEPLGRKLAGWWSRRLEPPAFGASHRHGERSEAIQSRRVSTGDEFDPKVDLTTLQSHYGWIASLRSQRRFI